MNRKINAIYFSATGTTEKVVCQTADKIADNMKNETAVNKINFTLPAVRKEAVSFMEEDLVIIGVPVYAGRVPNVLLN
jgi:flavodoxin